MLRNLLATFAVPALMLVRRHFGSGTSLQNNNGESILQLGKPAFLVKVGGCKQTEHPVQSDAREGACRMSGVEGGYPEGQKG